MAEYALRQYWKHWSEPSESGSGLTFKNIIPRLEQDGPDDEQDGSDDEEPGQSGEKHQPAGADHTEEDQPVVQNPGASTTIRTPKEHTSHEERINFLRHMIHQDSEVYQAVVEILAQMPVSFLFITVLCISVNSRVLIGWW